MQLTGLSSGWLLVMRLKLYHFCVPPAAKVTDTDRCTSCYYRVLGSSLLCIAIATSGHGQLNCAISCRSCLPPILGLLGLLHHTHCDHTRGWCDEWIHHLGTPDGCINSKTNSHLPHQSPSLKPTSGSQFVAHSLHLCCPCSHGYTTTHTAVPLQSVPVGICVRSSCLTVELDSVLFFCFGHCAVQQENHQRMLCCSHRSYPLACTNGHNSLHSLASCI